MHRNVSLTNPFEIAVWQIPTARPVSHIIPLPGSDIYALILPTAQGTNILILNPASWVPLRIWTLDFQLLSVVSFSSSFPKGFSLAAITHDYCMVLVGDYVWLPPTEGTKGNDLTEHQESARKSLFEDIFGASAIKSLKPVESTFPISSSMDLGVGETHSKTIDTRLLDGPAYLLPPIETLFESLMSDVLRENKDPEQTISRAGSVEAEMDIDEPEPIVVKVGAPPKDRVVADNEIGNFASLFRELKTASKSITFLCGSACSPSYATGNLLASSSYVNGNSPTKLPNGHLPPSVHVNGVLSSTKRHQKPKPLPVILDSASQGSVSSDPITPIAVGQKRKLPSP